ncbi:MAG: acyl-CoA dehydrogenase family protein, partial [Actinomycetota bacterium]|nr:acyl-CoA dehydrogenase family protein [Actinomycetota bacterium]
TGLSIPKKYGGLEMGKVDVCIIAEEIAYGLPALIPFLEIAQLYTYVIKLGGTEEQKKRFLTRLAGGEIGCYALTDEGPGSDPVSMKSTASQKDSEFVINGKKRLITFADMADLFALFAREDSGDKSISCFIVEKDTPGLKFDKHCQLSGLRGHRAYDLKLENLHVPLENRIGSRGDGLRLALQVLNNTRISLAFGYVGLSRAALDAAIKHAKTRVIAGNTISKNQGISFPIAEIATEIDAARLLAYRAAVLSEREANHRKHTSMAKMFAGEVLIKAVTLANRVLGGYGSDMEWTVERYVRDAFAWIAAQGTPEVQKLIISREVIGK